MNVYLENVALGGVILVTLEEGFADREPLEEDSAGDDGGAGREPLDEGGHSLDKVGAAVDKKANVEPRFLGSDFFSRNLKRGRFRS